MTQQHRRMPDVVHNWRLGRKLGAGFSGAIFTAQHVHTGQVAAIKMQPFDEPCPTNRYERAFYPALQGGEGMPTLWAQGQQGYWDYLVIDLLGRSLDSLHRELIQKQDVWDLRSVCCVAIQVISRLEWMHSRGILHRDIQLGNCVLGLEPRHETLYMIDFGFSKFYIDPHTKRHIPDSRAPRDFIGNYWFSSVRVHCQGRVPSRRDDMEALALMLVHMLTPGGLTWTRNGVPQTSVAHDHLMAEKRASRPEDLCRGLPPVFEEFLRASRKLDFAARPDYEYWIEEFRDLADEYGFEDIDQFMWPSPHPKPTVRVTAAPKPAPQKKAADMEKVLNQLATLDLGGASRQVLGERNNLVNRDSPPAAPKDGKGAKDAGAKGAAAAAGTGKKPEVIELSSDDSADDENAHARSRTLRGRTTKAARLAQLARDAGAAADNRALAGAVRGLAQVMQENRSKTLTKEGFAVLDALQRQLADPDVFVVPAAAAKRASGAGGGSEGGDGGEGQDGSARETRQGKMNKLWRLGADVRAARSNEQLARLVAEFGQVIYRSGGRTVTKDGLGFLLALSTRLEALSS